MKGPVSEVWHTSTISAQENVNFITGNVRTAGSQIICEVHRNLTETTHREFLLTPNKTTFLPFGLVVGETELDKWYRFSLFHYKTHVRVLMFHRLRRKTFRTSKLPGCINRLHH